MKIIGPNLELYMAYIGLKSHDLLPPLSIAYGNNAVYALALRERELILLLRQT